MFDNYSDFEQRFQMILFSLLAALLCTLIAVLLLMIRRPRKSDGGFDIDFHQEGYQLQNRDTPWGGGNEGTLASSHIENRVDGG